MAIFRKDHLKVHVDQLDKYHQELREIILGNKPVVNNCHDYNCEADQFVKEFVDVDLDKLHYAIGYFKVAVEGLKQLEKKKAKRNHKS